MISSAILRRARSYLVGWQNWRQRQAIRRALPVFRSLDRKEAQSRARHSKGAAQILAEKRRIMTQVLSGCRNWRAG